tara:strand:+ start:95 stop:685 length:591 start_codon:yes stop_codon:yes gene_type:complete
VKYPVPKEHGLTEIRWHGRGGQGVVTAGEILAEAALDEGRYFQAFPEFGAERTGAPVKAYTRIGDEPIDLHCPISEPSVVVVLDSTLLASIDVFEGLSDGGAVIINSPRSPDEIAPQSRLGNRFIATVDATSIAMDTLGRNIPNTAMLGALLSATAILDKNTCLKVIVRRLSVRFPQHIVEANKAAFEQAFSTVRV